MMEYIIRDSRRQYVPAPPTLDATQRLAGYNKSLALRQARSELKKDLKAGKLQLRDVLGWDWVQGMKLLDLLRALPMISNKRATALMVRQRINLENTVSRCSQGQLQRVVAHVEKNRPEAEKRRQETFSA